MTPAHSAIMMVVHFQIFTLSHFAFIDFLRLIYDGSLANRTAVPLPVVDVTVYYCTNSSGIRGVRVFTHHRFRGIFNVSYQYISSKPVNILSIDDQKRQNQKPSRQYRYPMSYHLVLVALKLNGSQAHGVSGIFESHGDRSCETQEVRIGAHMRWAPMSDIRLG